MDISLTDETILISYEYFQESLNVFWVVIPVTMATVIVMETA